MKKLLIRSASVATIMSLLTACGIEDHPKEVEFPDNVSVIPETEAPAPEVQEEFSVVTATSLKALAPGLNIGVAVPAGGNSNSIINSPESKTVIQQYFNQLSAENIMKQTSLQPEQGTFFYADADALVQYAKDSSLTVHGHVLVWHSQIANWMQNFEGNEAEWITMMEDHATQVATHFEEAGDNDTVTSWDVVNEAFMENGEYRGAKTTTDSADGSVWYENIGEKFIPLAFTAARAADPDADLYYNDYNLIWNSDKLGAVIDMVEAMQADGVSIDGIGFQSHISVNSPDISTIKAQFQKVVDIRPKIKLKITELDVRMNNENGTDFTTLTSARAEEQKDYYHDIVQAYLDIVPEDQRGGITVWGIIDGDSWLQSFPAPTIEWPLLFNDDFTPKPALQGFANALEEADFTPAPEIPPFFTTDFETDLDSWGPRGDATVTLETTEAHTGNNSALVVGRTANWQGISKSVVGLFTAGETYNVSAWVKLSDDASTVTPSMKLTLEINHGAGDGTTEYLEMTTPVTVSAGDWVELTGTYMHTITTVANSANVYVEGSETTVDFYVDDISITPSTPVVEEPVGPAELIVDGDFEDGIGSWGPRGDATVTLETTEAHAGNNSALVVGRTANWQGISKSVVGLFTAGESYNVSAWVKLSDDASTVTPSMKLTLEINHGEGDGTTEYLEMTTPVTVAAGDWVELTGTYTHTITTVANSANLYVEGSETTVDFYVDDISVTLVE
ncbi:endo-1,4-beta-xylanase [Colwellia sp. C1TZA3]|uniref:endo-1,4-beta-xylanase n=1 Tax=Colwellia sp. C1TZA3 TaxID=2508879 RepID=UPI001CB90B24|nr:endo-1,4-beta-xylanase [Colwellia sp. C1TZA3]